MDVTTITSLISSVGFPIVVCFVLFKQVDKLSNTLVELSATLSSINARLDNIEDAIEK